MNVHQCDVTFRVIGLSSIVVSKVSYEITCDEEYIEIWLKQFHLLKHHFE